MLVYEFSADEGYYQGGKFQFEIDVPEAYNMVVSINTFRNSFR